MNKISWQLAHLKLQNVTAENHWEIRYMYMVLYGVPLYDEIFASFHSIFRVSILSDERYGYIVILTCSFISFASILENCGIFKIVYYIIYIKAEFLLKPEILKLVQYSTICIYGIGYCRFFIYISFNRTCFNNPSVNYLHNSVECFHIIISGVLQYWF